MSLRRVPPNLLVGDGATNFAWEHNISVVPHDALVSKNARERYLRWRDDLRRAGGGRLTPGSSSPANNSYDEDMADLEYEERVRAKQRRDHTNAMLTGTWNEGQPDSPASPALMDPSDESFQYFNSSPNSVDNKPSTPPSPGRNFLNVLSSFRAVSRSPSAQSFRDGGSPPKRPRFTTRQSSDGQSRTHSLLGAGSGGVEAPKAKADIDLSLGDVPIGHKRHQAERTDGPSSPIAGSFPSSLDTITGPPMDEYIPEALHMDVDEDMITDTVGAIAIDLFGNIAAGSSSGGIGMKHRGRVGPAALVGIGTAVIPLDPQDEDGTTVAAVTSGTGEHMATTMASQKCAERLYFGTRRGPRGQNLPAVEEESMQSFVQDDFMNHPGVRNGHSGGAIGVMAVKKTHHGFFLHFAHNTDSFALASMHSDEKDAKCVMSRMGDHGSVVLGGRKMKTS